MIDHHIILNYFPVFIDFYFYSKRDYIIYNNFLKLGTKKLLNNKIENITN